ncbi:hypothetical protein VTJ04DRAFT_3333 [Mycothermus thermophilus]|uniref:uncharacterized protein n=1 Tax=Humicola insolens TaxID=85995 RepID=UPI003742A739
MGGERLTASRSQPMCSSKFVRVRVMGMARQTRRQVPALWGPASFRRGGPAEGGSGRGAGVWRRGNSRPNRQGQPGRDDVAATKLSSMRRKPW